jgi:hypothetical protein
MLALGPVQRSPTREFESRILPMLTRDRRASAGMQPGTRTIGYA